MSNHTAGNTDQIKMLNREANRVAALLQAAEDRSMEAWDKPAGVQDRISRTVRKHGVALRRLEAQIMRLEHGETVA